MNANWIDAARACFTAGRPCALVTVTAARGSTPREPGARMLVTLEGIVGTIGGGQLEQNAIDLARACFAGGSGETIRRSYSLGPELGQCCGGNVELSIEPLLRAESGKLERWTAFYEAEQPVDHLYLFGAGHVGLVLAQIAAALPYRLHWIDGRREMAVKAAAVNLPIVISVQPAREVDRAEANGFFLVMTHSHALDLEICARVLKRGDFAFLGLIGSATKRARFVRRLRDRGIPEVQLARLVCPIGISGIHSKLPAAIAVAAAAQLLASSEKNAARRLNIA